MSEDEPLSSFAAFVHEHNLSSRTADLCRLAFKLGIAIGKRQAEAMTPPKPERRRGYHPALDKDTAPGEFR